MAKDPDNLAAEFETENTGGLLSGFLAEEDEFDRRALWRLGSWGVAAVGCVIVAVMANQSSLIVRRDQVAAADLSRQAERLQQLAKDNRNDARRLASAIDTLNTDRDRLYSRVSTLEQGLDSVTGAITRQAASPTATAPTAAAPATSASQPAPPSPAPTVAPVATAQPSAADKPATPATDKPAVADKPMATPDKVTAADKPQPAADKSQAAADKPQATADKPALPSAAAEASLPVIASSSPEPAKQEPAKADAPSPSTPLMSAKSFMAPPDPAAGKLEPSKPAAGDVAASPIPDVVAAAPASEADEDEATAPKAKIQRTEFGVDLGTANSVNGLRALWRGLLKSKSNVALTALKPIIVIKENTNGLGMQLRLVAGPLNDAGTAAKICAGLSLNQRTCDTAIYDGQRLTLKPDDEPAAVKPVQQQRRRLAPKRAAAATPAPAVEEPKKPEPTTFSSMFGRKNQ